MDSSHQITKEALSQLLFMISAQHSELLVLLNGYNSDRSIEVNSMLIYACPYSSQL